MNDAVIAGELEDERDFLLRSLEDLEREHDAGDLSGEDYRALRDSYTARTAAVLRAIDARASTDDTVRTEDADAATAEHATPTANGPHRPRSPRSRSHRPRSPRSRSPRSRRRVGLVIAGAVVVFALLAVVLVNVFSGTRLPGETVTGSVSLSSGRQVQRTLDQAETLEQQGNAAQALPLYRQVLASEPNNVEALTEEGWLEFEAGVEAKNATLLTDGQNVEQRAERAAPHMPVPHLYLGSMLLVGGNPSGAVTQYSQFLADGPSITEIQQATPFIDKAYQEVGRTPPSLPAS